MKNYGESLAYWYFRLNGFIPMTDFVLHGDEELDDSDCDLIAVRFPHVWEEVGGQDNDWDKDLLKVLGQDGKRTLAVFVQVKTGTDDGNRPGKIGEYFDRHLDYLVKRLGFWPENEVGRAIYDLRNTPMAINADYALSKIVFLRDLPLPRRQPHWLEWRLEDMIDFIYQRMVKDQPEKIPARMHFPDHLIQFVIDQAMTPRYRFPPPAAD